MNARPDDIMASKTTKATNQFSTNQILLVQERRLRALQQRNLQKDKKEKAYLKTLQ
jgi:hypothetical protein